MPQPIILDPFARNMRWKLREDARLAPKPWRWPLPRIGTTDPRVVGAQCVDERRAVDLGYGVAAAEQSSLVPIYAAQNGEVTQATETASGYSVSIEHGNRAWQTHYAHLAQLNVIPCRPRLHRRELALAGDVIGYASRSPLRVHFELWQWTDARGYVSVDPALYLPHWTITAAQPKPIGFAPKEAA